MSEFNNNQSNSYQYGAPQPGGLGSAPVELLENKNIATSIVLSIVTCGIYGIIWTYQICKKVKLLCENSADVTGEFLCLLFVPYYGVYWAYSRGKKLAEARNSRGLGTASDNSLVYLLLSLFGLSIVTYAMIQNELNQVADILTANPAAYSANAANGNQQGYNNQPGYNQPNYNQPNYNQPNYNQQNYNQQNYNQSYNQQGYNQQNYNQQNQSYDPTTAYSQTDYGSNQGTNQDM